MKGHIDDFIASYGHAPESLTADAGYGSKENYLYLEELGITPYVKYNYFDKEQTEEKNKHRKNHKQKHPFHADKLPYNEQTDTYTCPMGQQMRYIGQRLTEQRPATFRHISSTKPKTAPAAPYVGLAIKLEAIALSNVLHTLSASNIK